MSRLGGHDRPVLKMALADLASGEVRAGRGMDEYHEAKASAIVPATLAEMMAEDGKRLGLEIVLCRNERELERSTQAFAIMPKESGLWIWNELTPTYFVLPAAQRVLRQWLDLPDGAMGRALHVLRVKP